MPNAAATSRPDVEGIAARVRLLAEIGDWSLLGDYADDNILALIEYIEALEEAGIAVLMETDFATRPASGEPIVGINNKHGAAHRKLRDLLAGLRVPDDKN